MAIMIIYRKRRKNLEVDMVNVEMVKKVEETLMVDYT